MKKQIILAIWMILVITPGVFAEDKYSGRRAGVFLEQPIGAKAVGMGEAFIVQTRDINSIWWNPAGLGDMKRYEILLMHDEYIQGIRQEYGGVGIPLKNNYGTIGFSFNYLDYGKLKRTTITSGNAGLTTGNFGANSYVVSLAYGRRFERFNLGANLKYINDKLDRVSASAFGGDMGIQFPVNDFITIGYTAQNIGTKLKYENEQSTLPLTHRIGLGYFQPNGQINFEVDAVKSLNDQWQVHLGGELWAVRDWFALRGGYVSGRDTDDKYTVGAGFKYNNLRLDYAFVPFGSLGSSHKASLQFKFGTSSRDAQESF